MTKKLDKRKLDKKNRNVAINLTTLLCGLFVGLILGLGTLVHELGHYSFAYLFNKSAIEGLYYSPVDVLMGSISFKNLTDGTILAYVKYHGDVFEVFSEPQALLVLFGGLIFELTFFGLVLIALQKLSNKYKKENQANLYVRGFLGGIIVSMVKMADSWIRDGAQAVLHFTENTYVVRGVFLWFFFFGSIVSGYFVGAYASKTYLRLKSRICLILSKIWSEDYGSSFLTPTHNTNPSKQSPLPPLQGD